MYIDVDDHRTHHDNNISYINITVYAVPTAVFMGYTCTCDNIILQTELKLYVMGGGG